jgi:hypothetical protein
MGFFTSLGQTTWADVINNHKVPAKGGKFVPKHHHQDVETFRDEAVKRWVEIGMELWPTAFRFRVGANGDCTGFEREAIIN